MAASPQFKIYNAQGEYVAACKWAEESAALASFLGNGTTIRFGHQRVLWREGSEEWPAHESYDRVAALIYQRLDERS